MIEDPLKEFSDSISDTSVHSSVIAVYTAEYFCSGDINVTELCSRILNKNLIDLETVTKRIADAIKENVAINGSEQTWATVLKQLLHQEKVSGRTLATIYEIISRILFDTGTDSNGTAIVSEQYWNIFLGLKGFETTFEYLLKINNRQCEAVLMSFLNRAIAKQMANLKKSVHSQGDIYVPGTLVRFIGKAFKGDTECSKDFWLSMLDSVIKVIEPVMDSAGDTIAESHQKMLYTGIEWQLLLDVITSNNFLTIPNTSTVTLLAFIMKCLVFFKHLVYKSESIKGQMREYFVTKKIRISKPIARLFAISSTATRAEDVNAMINLLLEISFEIKCNSNLDTPQKLLIKNSLFFEITLSFLYKYSKYVSDGPLIVQYLNWIITSVQGSYINYQIIHYVFFDSIL